MNKNKKKMYAKGQTTFIVIIGIMVVALVAVGVGWIMRGGEMPTMSQGGNPSPTATTGGVPIDSLQAIQTERYSETTEGSNDLEFWSKGADVTNTLLSARETITLSSGLVTDTSVPNLRSTSNQNGLDLWVEGGSAYYDKKVPTWSIDYNVQTGKGVLIGDGGDAFNYAVLSEQVGTIADLDTLEAVDTGVVASGTAGVYNYTNSTADETVYIRFNLGNDGTDSVLKCAVLCIGDPDSTLEGNEITGISVSKYSGSSVGNVPSNMLPQFTNSAGTGGYQCVQIGDIVNDGSLTKGVYQMDLTVDETYFINGESFYIAVDDNCGYLARDYPSQNLKATVENVKIINAE